MSTITIDMDTQTEWEYLDIMASRGVPAARLMGLLGAALH